MAFGAILIIVACTLCGVCFSMELAAREKNLRFFKNFILFLKNEITYKVTPVYDAIRHFCEENKDCENSIVETLNNCQKQEDLVDCFALNKENISFSDVDVSVITDFFKQLGKSDLKGQEDLFDVTLERLEENINDAKGIYEQKGRVFKALGLGVGIVIALLLI